MEGQLRSHVLGKRGAVRLAAPANLYPTALLPGLTAFRSAHPAVRLEFADVTSDEAIHRLRLGQVDMAIGILGSTEKDLRMRVLGHYPYVALVPENHALAHQHQIRWHDIRTEDVVVLQARDSVTSRVTQALRDAGMTPQAAYRVNELSTASALIEGGFGIGLMGYWSAQHILRPGWLIKELTEPFFNGALHVITLASIELTPQVRALQALLCQHALKYTDLSDALSAAPRKL